MFDQDLLRTFVAIVDAGSFSAAAESVGRTPSAISMQVRRLEEAAGRRLFERSAQGVLLTADGEILLVHAREILQAHAMAQEALAAERSARRLRIGLTDTYVPSLLAPHLADLIRLFPDTNLRIETGGSPLLLRRLEEAALDLAFLTEHQLAGDPRGDLVYVERGVWACAEPCAALDQSPLPVALTFEGSTYRRLAQQQLRESSRAYRIAVSTNSESVVQAAVASGAAVALLPASRMLPGMRELQPSEGFPPVPPLQVRMRVGRHDLAPAGSWLVAKLRESRPLNAASETMTPQSRSSA